MHRSLDFILWVGSLNSGHTLEARFKDNQCSPGSRRRVQTSGSLLPLNLIPFFTLPLTYTSLYYPWAVYTLFLFPGLHAFLHPICCFCPFSLLLIFLTGPGMHSSSPLYSWGNPVPPSGPCEMTRLWRNSVGFSPSWTDPVPPFNPPGAVNLSSSSRLSGLLLPFSQACLVPATRTKAHKSRDHLRLPFVSLSDPSTVTHSATIMMVFPPKCI